MLLNVGPAHPAMHGIIRIVTKLDGEQMSHRRRYVYLHEVSRRGGDGRLHAQPYTDRLT